VFDYAINNEAEASVNLPPFLTTNSYIGDMKLMAKRKLTQYELKRQVDFAIGKRYGRLTVVGEPSHVKSNITKVMVKCDCGTYKEVQINHLRSGVTVSCGCYQSEVVSKSEIYGIGNLALSYSRYKTSAKKRHREFKLSREQFVSLVTQNCFYCNAPPSNMIKDALYKNHTLYSGIDRVDNKKGYTIENCVPCCTICNKMKSAMGCDDFINHIKLILKTQSQR